MPGKPLVSLNEVTLDERSHGERFQVRLARIGAQLGLSKLGCTLHVVPPAARAWPRHAHHEADELFYVLSGTGEYHFGDELFPVKAGDCLGAPAGKIAHQIVNSGSEELRYLALSTLGNFDIVEYPDSGKFGVVAGMQNGDFKTASFRYMGRSGPSVDY